MRKAVLVLVFVLLVIGLIVPLHAQTVGYIEGGGQIIEAPDGLKRPDWLVISFGGWVQNPANPVGEWQVNFHNVNKEGFDQTHFHTTNITTFTLYAPTSNTCDAAMNFTAIGEWNGMPGYKLTFRAGDDGTPNDGYADTIRVELRNPNGVLVYDTNWATEFVSESSCVGSARTGLDAGNITIYKP